MLSCKDITENANQYLDRELGFFGRLNVKIHLMICVNCKRYVEQLRTTIAMLGKLQKPAPEIEDAQAENIISQLKNHHHH